MKPPRNTKLLKATYIKDYIYRFEFSNGKVFDTNFKPMLYLGTMYRKYLDVTKFKKMKIMDEWGDISWGDWDLCFHIESYYGEKKITPLPKKYYIDALKKVGLYNVGKNRKNQKRKNHIKK